MIFRQFNNSDKISRLIAFLIIAFLAGISTLMLYTSDTVKLYPKRVTVLGSEEVPGKFRIYYDINSNGLPELFYFTSYTGEDVIEYHNDKRGFVDVIRPGGYFLRNIPSFVFGDTDNDGFSELYLFTLRNDSILLNGYELLGDDGHFVVDFPIEKGIHNAERNDFVLLEPQVVDLDLDGAEEIVFIIRAGYNLSPRKIYSFHPGTQKLEQTRNSAAAFIGSQVYPHPEMDEQIIITACNAVENYSVEDTIPFNDNSGWIIAYDKYLTVPIFVREYPDNKSFIQTSIVETLDGPKIINLVSEKTSSRCYLEKLSIDGKFEKSMNVSIGQDGYSLINYFSSEIEKVILYHSDTLFFYNYNLELESIEKRVGVPKTFHYTRGKSFINQNGFFLFGDGEKLIVRDQNLHIIGKIKIPDLENERYYTPSIKDHFSPGSYTILLSGEKSVLQLKVENNFLYKLRYILGLVIYIGFNFLFYLIFRLQNYFYNRRFNSQVKITSLQLQAVQNQLQPHFTFNVLNTIGSMIYKNKKDEAYEYLNYFSDMLRSTLLSGNRPNWQIGEELSFIGSYIDMENLRFGNVFSYSQTIAKGTDLSRLIPKLTIQAFVENAVKHGLMHKQGSCKLELSIHQTADYIIIEIKDNGIGRDAAADLPRQHNGLGNEILLNYIDAYNKINKVKFKLIIEDLFDEEGRAAGTKVNLFVPLDFKSIKP